jgi:3-dehydrosphinganine reductase
MGKSVAIRLAKKGASIIIVSRNVGKLEEALAQIKVLPQRQFYPHCIKLTYWSMKASAADPVKQRFQYISADLSEEDGAARVVAEAIAWNGHKAPDVVWCIAGSSRPGLFIETPKSIMRQQMDVNFWSCVDMAHAVLNEWLAPGNVGKGGQKHLIFTSSVVAFFPVAGYGPYAPAKAAIKSLCETLAQEVLLYGDEVKIHTVFPGTILSPGLQKENETKPEITNILEDSDPKQTPDQVADAAIAGLERGDYLVTVGFLGSAMRACAWGGSTRSNFVIDTALTWITSLIWPIISSDLNGKVTTYRKKHGHPSTYVKKP